MSQTRSAASPSQPEHASPRRLLRLRSLPTRNIPTQGAKKRKRRTPSERTTPTEPLRDASQLQPLGTHEHQSSQSVEYLAVLTPEERTQYRLAGQPFDQEPPCNPFPHAAVAPSQHRDNHDGPKLHHLKQRVHNKPASGAPAPTPTPTLRLQHLSAITAVLHRCLMDQDYARASRALGLILRDSLRGHSIDIRNEGRWGVGAEILLQSRSRGQRATLRAAQQPPSRRALLFTREDFEKAKRYYERLIVQYPFNKPYSAAVNALDFYQALFGLWIYLVHEECKSGSATTSSSFPGGDEQLELDQAREIASRMDACMSGVPFSDDLELMRLRGMVALWIADLVEACSVEAIASFDGDGLPLGSTPMDEITADVVHIALDDRTQRSPWPDPRTEVAQARRVAQNMFAKIKGGGIIDDGSDE